MPNDGCYIVSHEGQGMGAPPIHRPFVKELYEVPPPAPPSGRGAAHSCGAGQVRGATVSIYAVLWFA
jgi:hypothetical protein